MTSITRRSTLQLAAGAAGMTFAATGPALASQEEAIPDFDRLTTRHRKVKIGELDIFYREAGPVDAPAILLLHGFPSSSHMFRHLIPALADRYRVVAPDYPGFGNSSFPDPDSFTYSFARLAEIMVQFTDAVGLKRYAMYIQDYGAPIGLRLALLQPNRVTGIISQNGNAYEEGLSDGWDPLRAYWADPVDQESCSPVRLAR